MIFALLSRDAALAPLTHSCNVSKPWCGRCAKCVYVWLQMSAHLPPAIVLETFGCDLGELSANDRWLRELLGLAEHSPFECVGSPAEARLALALLPKNGATRGPRLEALATEVGAIEIASLAGPLLGVGPHAMPAHVAAKVMPILEDAARTAAARIAR
ncbi:hypothetical protein BH11MYX2_BH11MYX2_23230 [soil metagenome]